MVRKIQGTLLKLTCLYFQIDFFTTIQLHFLPQKLKQQFSIPGDYAFPKNDSAPSVGILMFRKNLVFLI